MMTGCGLFTDVELEQLIFKILVVIEVNFLLNRHA